MRTFTPVALPLVLLTAALLALTPFALASEVQFADADPVQIFLTLLCTMDTQELSESTQSVEDFPESLSERLGTYCGEAVLDALLNMRFPFSFQVDALAERPDGAPEALTLTGCLRQDVQAGQITGIRLNFPE